MELVLLWVLVLAAVVCAPLMWGCRECVRRIQRRFAKRMRSIEAATEALSYLAQIRADPAKGKERSHAFARLCEARQHFLRVLYPTGRFAGQRPFASLGAVAQEVIAGTLRERLLTENTRALEPVAERSYELLRAGYKTLAEETAEGERGAGRGQ